MGWLGVMGWVNGLVRFFVSRLRSSATTVPVHTHTRAQKKRNNFLDCLSLVPGSLSLFSFLFFVFSSFFIDQQPRSFLLLSLTLLHSHSPLHFTSSLSRLVLFLLSHSFPSLVITTTKKIPQNGNNNKARCSWRRRRRTTPTTAPYTHPPVQQQQPQPQLTQGQRKPGPMARFPQPARCHLPRRRLGL